MDVQILPLVPKVALPGAARAALRRAVPPGYGVQEQCLPFTAATALGFAIPSPISFGLCETAEVPRGAHAFRSPIEPCARDHPGYDPRVLYVHDDPECRFEKNAFTFDAVDLPEGAGKRPYTPVQPGLSFFDREDQQDLFKLHLPYIWRTAADVDTLFVPAINRAPLSASLQAGLVETGWYAHPVNMIFRRPPMGDALHVKAGDVIAQAVFVARDHRRPELHVLASHNRLARELRAELAAWFKSHEQDRSAYKRLARSQHGRVTSEDR